MKKTNLFCLLRFQKILKKSEKLFFILIFALFIGITSGSAQNYMNFEEAATTLKEEIVKKSSSSDLKASANQQGASDSAILIFYQMMLTNLEASKDVKDALEATFVKPNYTGPKKIAADQARDQIKVLLIQ